LGLHLQISNRPDKLYSIEDFVVDQDDHREKVVAPTLCAKITQVRRTEASFCWGDWTQRGHRQPVPDI